MHIEERIERLERAVQALHAKFGHKWQRDLATSVYFRKSCACGVSEPITADEYENLPQPWDPNEEF